MQAIINKQYKQLYKNIFNEWLDNMKQQTSTQDNIHLAKAKEALNTFCKHVDDYLSESLKPKTSANKQAEIKQEQKIQNKQINTTKKKIQNKQSNDNLSIQKPSESKISLCSQQTTMQKYESNINSPETKQTSFTLFSTLLEQNKSKLELPIKINLNKQSSPLFPSVVSTQLNTCSLFSSPPVPKSNNTSNQSLFSIPFNNSLFSQIIDLSVSHSDSSNKTFIKQQSNSKQKINNISLFQIPSPANPFLKKINPATNQTMKSFDYYDDGSDCQQYDDQEQVQDQEYVQDSQELQNEVEQSKQNTILLSYVTETSEDDVEEIDVSYLHHQHIGKYISNYLSPQRCQQYLRIINDYYPSNYFHVGPRYELLGFLSTLSKKIELKQQPQPTNTFNLDINMKQLGQKVSKFMTIDKIMNIEQISRSYYSSNYFHVGPRRTMLEYVRSLVKMSMESYQHA